MKRKIRRGLRRLIEWAYVTEIIGQKECPMMLRWTLLTIGPKDEPWLKLLLHHFPPNVSDRDPHDHPRSFVTFILRGGYFNTEWEEYGTATGRWEDGREEDLGVVHVPTIEHMEAGAIRYRPAEHTHIVETDDRGCWSLVLMGPMVREWGFLKDGKWMAWKPYVERFGGVVRCDTGELEETEEAEYPPYRTAADYKTQAPPI